jgi:hypothetical protein
MRGPYSHTLIAAVLGIVLSPLCANATSLTNLIAGTDLSVGGLTFSDWSVVDFSDVSVDFDSIDVTAHTSAGPGLQFQLPLSTSGDIIELSFSFTVTSAVGPLVDSALALQAATSGAGSVLLLSADIAGAPLLVSDLLPDASVPLPNLSAASVQAALLIDDVGALSGASWSFTTVPEPASALLVLIGLLALPGRRTSPRIRVSE